MAMIPLCEYAKRHGMKRTSVYDRLRRGCFSEYRKIGIQWFIEESEPPNGKGRRERIPADKILEGRESNRLE